MAASLWRQCSWRTLRACLRKAQQNLSHTGDQIWVRTVVTTQSSGTRCTDVFKQQEVTAAELAADQRAEESQLTQLSVDDALQQEDYFNLKELVTLRDLFNARVHFGHNAGLRHESMVPYLFGTRQGVDIIDLEKTLPLLHHAMNVCAHIVYRGGMVLFLSRHMQVLPWVERMAKEVGEYSHCRPWKRGIFTNAANVFGTLPIYPEICIFFNTQDSVFETHRGVVEASKLLVPTIGIVDTNCDCSDITYPIPANDDTPLAQHLFINLFRTVVLRAKEKRKEDGLEVITPVERSS